MEIIQLILAAIILVTIYKKMLKWGNADGLSKKQKYVPIGLGILSVIVSFLFVAGIALFSVKVLGFHLDEIENQSLRAAVKAFTMAGLTEEIAKLLMIILSIKLFSPKRVYEYTLIGAAVGIGFTIHEELLYGGSIAGLLRFITVAMHMVLGIIMGKNLGIGIVLTAGYILFSTVSTTFSVNNVMSPFMAAWLPNFIFLGLSIPLYIRASK